MAFLSAVVGLEHPEDGDHEDGAPSRKLEQVEQRQAAQAVNEPLHAPLGRERVDASTNVCCGSCAFHACQGVASHGPAMRSRALPACGDDALRGSKLAACAGASSPRPPPPPPAWPLIGQQSGQPLLRLAPLRIGLVEAPAQIADDVILLNQALAQHLDFDP